MRSFRSPRVDKQPRRRRLEKNRGHELDWWKNLGSRGSADRAFLLCSEKDPKPGCSLVHTYTTGAMAPSLGLSGAALRFRRSVAAKKLQELERKSPATGPRAYPSP